MSDQKLSASLDMDYHRPQFVSLPFWSESHGQFAQLFDHGGVEYVIRWDGDWRKSPEISCDRVREESASLVHQSVERKRIWRNSTPMSYGVWGQIRLSHNQDSRYPVIKLAHYDLESREAIENEFKMLKRVSGNAAVQFDNQPLTDENGIFGFKMERLYPLDLSQTKDSLAIVEGIVSCLEAQGIIHGDLSPNNIMSDRDGNVKLIDFGLSGQIDEETCTYNPYRRLGYTHYSAQMNLDQLESLRRMLDASAALNE